MGYARYPRRIVCLTEETTETLYLLGEEDRIVGISGYTVRPARARREKPKVAAFTSAKLDKILALEPDLVLGFSDLQADIAAALIRAGVAVYVFNQRTVQGILDMVQTLGALVGAGARAEALVAVLHDKAYAPPAAGPKPRVYFEEWDEPRICGIRWVSELMALAGAEDIFADQAQAPAARERIIADDRLILARRPDIIIGSWCGKRFRPERVRARAGWEVLPAVQNHHLYEIKAADILQPGPAALTDGLDQLRAIVARWRTTLEENA